MKIRICIALIALVPLLSVTASGGVESAEAAPASVALILPGPVEDADFNFLGFKAMDDIASIHGAETAYQERVSPADSERVARAFIADGFDTIAFHGGQFTTTLLKLADQYPDNHFAIVTRAPIDDAPRNVWAIGRRWSEGFYPFGILAARTTSTKTIGVVAGIKLSDWVEAINTIKKAAATVDPAITVRHTFTGDQNDSVAARSATAALVDAGADVIILLVNGGTFGSIQAVQGTDVRLISFYTDKQELARDNMVGSLLFDFSHAYDTVVGNILDGKDGGYHEMRPGSGMEMTELYHVADRDAEEARSIWSDISTKRTIIPADMTAVE